MDDGRENNNKLPKDHSNNESLDTGNISYVVSEKLNTVAELENSANNSIHDHQKNNSSMLVLNNEIASELERIKKRTDALRANMKAKMTENARLYGVDVEQFGNRVKTMSETVTNIRKDLESNLSAGVITEIGRNLKDILNDLTKYKGKLSKRKGVVTKQNQDDKASAAEDLMGLENSTSEVNILDKIMGDFTSELEGKIHNLIGEMNNLKLAD